MNNLPIVPGRARRLAYGEYVRRCHSRSTYEPIPVQVQEYNLHESPTLLELINNTQVFVCNKSSFCAICQDMTLPGNNIMRKLKCNHEYHMQCIDVWLSSTNVCPLCKKVII